MNDELRFRSLVSVLLVEAIGGITFGIVTLAGREFLGELVPLWIPVASVAFGLACLTAAAGVTRRSTWARGLTVGVQAVTVASGVLGFAYSSQPVLLAAILLGGFGLWLLRDSTMQRR